MFTYAEDVKTDLVGMLNAGEKFPYSEGGFDGACGLGGDKTVDADFHWFLYDVI